MLCWNLLVILNRQFIIPTRLTELECYGHWLGDDVRPMFVLLQKIPEGSIILLHACAHNPTGVDPTVRMFLALIIHLSVGLLTVFKPKPRFSATTLQNRNGNFLWA